MTGPSPTPPILDRVLSWSVRRLLPVPAEYGVTAVVIVAVGVFRALVIGSIVPWLLFIPFVLAAGLLFGRGPGLFGALLAAVAAGVSIGRAAEPFWLTEAQWTGSVLFVLVASGIALLAAEVRDAFSRAARLGREKDTAHARLAEREAFLASVLASSTDRIEVLDLDARPTFVSEGGRAVAGTGDAPVADGDGSRGSWPGFWQGAAHTQAQDAVAAARAGECRSFVGEARVAGAPRWWDVAVSPVLGPDGRPHRILAVSRDVTQSRANEEALRRLAAELAFEQATLQALFQNAPVGLSLAGADGQSVLINEQMRRLLGRDISRGGIDRYLGAGAIHPDGTSYTLAQYPQVEAVRHGVETTAAPFLIERPDGSRLRTEISSVPLRDGDGAITGAVSVVVDVEARERAIEHQSLLTGELAHRMKNTMAMVQAIVHQSLRSAGTLAEARERIVSRFEALVRAQDLLTRGDWKLADLGAVAQSALDGVGQDGRVLIDGPPIEVGARAALSFTLVLHELATNALKYGALSVPDGRVAVRWRVDPVPGDRRVTFTWKETGGPPVAPPAQRGFGTRLIDTMGRTFGGSSALSYDPAGVAWLVETEAARLKIT